MMPRRLVVIPGPAYRPPSFRPLPLQLGERKLGQGPSMNWTNIGETIMFAAFGAGAMYAAPLFPDPVKTIAMVGGVGLIGYAAYTFLGSSGSAKTDPNKPFEEATPEQFAAVSGVFTQPVPGSSESWSLFGQNYDVKVLVTNSNPAKGVTIPIQITAREVGLPFDYLFDNISNEYLAASDQVSLKPKGQEGDTKPIPFTLSVRLNRWTNPRVVVLLTLKKLRVKGDPVILDTTHVTLH